jgi:hypothetical protein
MDYLYVLFRYGSDFLIITNKADQSVVLAAGEFEASLILIKPGFRPFLGHGFLLDGVDLGQQRFGMNGGCVERQPKRQHR